MPYVYVLSNPSYPEGTYKIGHTTKSVKNRMKELDSTGLLNPFELEAKYEVIDSKEAERVIHYMLSEYRVREDREFFTVSLEVIHAAALHAFTIGTMYIGDDSIFPYCITPNENCLESKPIDPTINWGTVLREAKHRYIEYEHQTVGSVLGYKHPYMRLRCSHEEKRARFERDIELKYARDWGEEALEYDALKDEVYTLTYDEQIKFDMQTAHNNNVFVKLGLGYVKINESIGDVVESVEEVCEPFIMYVGFALIAILIASSILK